MGLRLQGFAFLLWPLRWKWGRGSVFGKMLEEAHVVKPANLLWSLGKTLHLFVPWFLQLPKGGDDLRRAYMQ